MPRRGKIAKREVLADPIYNSKLVTRLVNSIMLDGKKGVAQKIVYEAFETVKEKTGNDPLEMFEKAMENIMPSPKRKSQRLICSPGCNHFIKRMTVPPRLRLRTPAHLLQRRFSEYRGVRWIHRRRCPASVCTWLLPCRHCGASRRYSRRQ